MSDIEIARSANSLPISEIAAKLNIPDDRINSLRQNQSQNMPRPHRLFKRQGPTAN